MASVHELYLLFHLNIKLNFIHIRNSQLSIIIYISLKYNNLILNIFQRRLAWWFNTFSSVGHVAHDVQFKCHTR
jgi:hypothetical protein